jgi:uncharacterized SAM-binding protein YcdF (DUF218 family)
LEEDALMFFILSKTAAFLVMPSNFLIALGFIGVALMVTRFKRAGSRIALACLVLLGLLGFSPLGTVLTHKLESRFPPWDPARGVPDGIVVLGGVISPLLSRDYGETIVNADAGRVVALVKLARAFPNARVVYSSGDASLMANGLAEAESLYPLLDGFGIPRERVMLESRSRNTVENAVFSKDLVKPKPDERWLLVTSAYHMPRAVGCFRRAGFPVEAYPVAWRTGKRVGFHLSSFLGGGLERLDFATHEWIGLIAYWLTGRTSELLPGPVTAN